MRGKHYAPLTILNINEANACQFAKNTKNDKYFANVASAKT